MWNAQRLRSTWPILESAVLMRYRSGIYLGQFSALDQYLPVEIQYFIISHFLAPLCSNESKHILTVLFLLNDFSFLEPFTQLLVSGVQEKVEFYISNAQAIRFCHSYLLGPVENNCDYLVLLRGELIYLDFII